MTYPASAPYGIPGYASALGVDQRDVLLIVYLVFVCLWAIFIGVVVLVSLALQITIFKVQSAERKEVWATRRIRWQHMSSNNSLRLVRTIHIDWLFYLTEIPQLSLALGPLTVFAFYQWTQRCIAPATAFVSATAVLITVAPLLFIAFLIIRVRRRPDGLARLYDRGSKYARRWSVMYDVYDDGKLFFIVPLTAAVLVRSAIVGFGRNGAYQVPLLLVLELALCFGAPPFPLQSHFHNLSDGRPKPCGSTSRSIAGDIID